MSSPKPERGEKYCSKKRRYPLHLSLEKDSASFLLREESLIIYNHLEGEDPTTIILSSTGRRSAPLPCREGEERNFTFYRDKGRKKSGALVD